MFGAEYAIWNGLLLGLRNEDPTPQHPSPTRVLQALLDHLPSVGFCCGAY